jgi:hypothetical protein
MNAARLFAVVAAGLTFSALSGCAPHSFRPANSRAHL